MPDLREPEPTPPPVPELHRESWSRNGEVCIAGLDPPIAGGARLASCLKLVLLAEERQVFLPAGGSRVGAAVRRAWAMGLDALAGMDDEAVRGLFEEDEHGFALNILVLVHAWPEGAVHPRPGIEESYRRHESVIAELSAPTEAKELSVAWHALWRLPPAMTWSEAGEKPWMKYPAVSFVAAVRPLHRRGDRTT